MLPLEHSTLETFRADMDKTLLGFMSKTQTLIATEVGMNIGITILRTVSNRTRICTFLKASTLKKIIMEINLVDFLEGNFQTKILEELPLLKNFLKRKLNPLLKRSKL